MCSNAFPAIDPMTPMTALGSKPDDVKRLCGSRRSDTSQRPCRLFGPEKASLKLGDGAKTGFSVREARSFLSRSGSYRTQTALIGRWEPALLYHSAASSVSAASGSAAGASAAGAASSAAGASAGAD